jgi:hypothetical protein
MAVATVATPIVVSGPFVSQLHGMWCLKAARLVATNYIMSAVQLQWA